MKKLLLLLALIFTLSFTSVLADVDICNQGRIYSDCENFCFDEQQHICTVDNVCIDECIETTTYANGCTEEVPEFGTLAVFVVLGVVGLFVYRKRN